MLASADAKRKLGLALAATLALGLIIFAAVNLLRPGADQPRTSDSVAIRKITLAETPSMVQEAVDKLQASKIAYAIPQGRSTYLVISTGASGERLELAGARRDQVLTATININLKSSSRGDRLIIAKLEDTVVDVRNIRVLVDGFPGMIPALINLDSLPLTTLPDVGELAVVSPEYNVRVMGNAVQVTGYARIFNGRFNIQVFSAGKGRILGEALEVRAAAGAPDWGSFRVNVPVNLSVGVREGVVLIYDPDSGAKVAIPVYFGSK